MVDNADEGKAIYIPLYLPGHWVVVCVDKKAGTFFYGNVFSELVYMKWKLIVGLLTGNSSEPVEPQKRKEIHNTIQSTFKPFFEKYWGNELAWKGNLLSCSQQDDDSSCGPCVINLLERLVKKDVKPWSPQDASGYRISLFTKMAQTVLDKIVGLMLGIVVCYI